MLGCKSTSPIKEYQENYLNKFMSKCAQGILSCTFFSNYFVLVSRNVYLDCKYLFSQIHYKYSQNRITYLMYTMKIFVYKQFEALKHLKAVTKFVKGVTSVDNNSHVKTRNRC